MPFSLYARLARRYHAAPAAFDRREFLRVALGASAGLLLSRADVLGANPSRGRRGRVIVVGAGFSGLVCAHRLVSAGYDVIVLEARQRIGGRVISFRDLIAGKTVEGGGELIGSNHPTWVALARRFQLELSPLVEEDDLLSPVIIAGRRLKAREVRALFNEMDAAYKMMNSSARPIIEDEPWRSLNSGALDDTTTAQWIAGLPLSQVCKRALTVEFTANNGVATSRQSFLGNLTQVKGGGVERYWLETEAFRCRGGNAQLAQKLAETIGDSRLRLGTPVRGVTVDGSKAVVRTAANEVFEADDVVLAVPPSTWRHIQFTPSLPRVLRPQMGVSVKYLAQVKRRFWRDRQAGADAITDGFASLTWEATNNQGTDANGAVLTSFSGGPAAQRARAAFARCKDAAYLETLEKMFPKFTANFVRGRFMDWPNELWTAAGYSFPAPGQITAIGPILREGLGRLHFAGEHTCYKFVGYMEGALNSGVLVADRLIRRDASQRTA